MLYINKIIKAIFRIFLIVSISFLLIDLIPGSPAQTILGVDAPIEQIELFNRTYGLDKDILSRYFYWIRNIFNANLGISLRYQVPIIDLIKDSIFVTVFISTLSLVISLIFSVSLAFYLNKTKNKTIVKIFDIILTLTMSIPSFFLALLFLLIFTIKFRIINITYNESLISLIIPSLIIAIPKIGQLTYNLKANIYKEIRQDYIKFLYSNGMKMKYLNYYVLKNAIITVLPLLALVFIDLITGVVIVEQIFSIPGIGKLVISAISSRDIILIQGIIIYTSFVVIIINLVIDILYSVLDKRIKKDEK